MSNNGTTVEVVQNVIRPEAAGIGTKTCTISTDVDNMEIAKELFNYCKYKDAEQMFLKMKGSEAAAWRILCYIITGDIGRKGGKIAVLLQESIKSQDAFIGDTVTSLKMLIDTYRGAIDRKTEHKAMASLYDAFNNIAKEQMTIMLSDINKKALDIVKKRGYTPSIYDDKAIPLRVLNNKLKKYRYRIRHYKPDDMIFVLETINTDSFFQEIVDEYVLMAQCNIIGAYKDRLDTRNQDILKYIKGLYISNVAHEKELIFIRSIDKPQFINILDKLDQKGWPRITMLCEKNTIYFNMANDEEKIMCKTEIERTSAASVITLLEYDDIIEKRGYLVCDSIVNQISKEDIAIGDSINYYTHEYVGPVQGIIYCDN